MADDTPDSGPSDFFQNLQKPQEENPMPPVQDLNSDEHAPKPNPFFEGLDKITSEKPEVSHAVRPDMPIGETLQHSFWSLGPSAVNFAKNAVHPFLHPQETAENVGSLALGLFQKAGIYGGHEFEKYPEAVGKMILDKYGSWDKFKQTLAQDPVGVASDLSLPLTGGGNTLAKIGGLTGKVGEIANTAGKVLDPFTTVGKGLELAGKGATAGAGLLTGSGMKPFERAAEAGYEGGSPARDFRAVQQGSLSGEQLVRETKEALDNIIRERGDAYQHDLLPIKQSIIPLGFNDVNAATRQAENFKAVVGNTTGVPVNFNSELGALKQELAAKISTWKLLGPEYHNAAGFDAMKQAINSIGDRYQKGTPQRALVDIYGNAINKTLKRDVPHYAEAMENYRDASDLIHQIQTTLSLPRDERKLNIDTALRKLASVMRRNVNTNYGQRENLIDALEKGGAPNLREKLAGLALSSPEAHGLARILPAIFSFKGSAIGEAVGLGMTSPKAMGSAFYHAGQVGRVAVPLAQSAKPLSYVNRYSEDNNHARGGKVERAMRAARRG